MFEFKITLNDDDYILFNQYHLLNSPSGKKSFMFFKILFPLICFMYLLILFGATSDFELSLILTIPMIISSILWIVYSKKNFLKPIKKRIKKMKKEGNLPYNKESILTFDDEFMHEITPSTETKTNYSLIEKIAVTEKAIYIYLNSISAYIIPTTTFSEETEKLKFLEFINSKTNILKNTKCT
ncbi:MAG: YcxB family protein [Clostridia bacterium]|nr:YcxB family protein [Clostridia bacterium]